jgi:hypothetical protein
MSPSVDSKRDKVSNWNEISFSEDLEHFWRNKDLILKESNAPDPSSITKLPLFDAEEFTED